MIGDALRNAAMRFGAALDLWHKGQLHDVEDTDAPPATKPQGSRQRPVARQAAPKAVETTSSASDAPQGAPDGDYESWLAALDLDAAEGEQKLDRVLQANPEYLKHLRETAPKTLASLRTRARKAGRTS
jgi:hypothetical protein